MQKIILASQSNARKELFSSLGIPFTIMPAQIDEKAIRDEDLIVRAEKIARAKAEKVLRDSNGIVIAADTFDVIGDTVLEKPYDENEAREMLQMLSGKNATVYTGVCYIDLENKINFSTTVSIEYVFRQLYAEEIDLYIKMYPVTEWAGGFALIYPYTNSFVSRVNGSWTGLAYGLPTEIIIPLLKKSGFEPHPKRV